MDDRDHDHGSTPRPPVSGSSEARPPAASAGFHCVECGYDLTGIAIGDRCPECGTAVVHTAEVGRGLTARQLAAVAIRFTVVVVVLFHLNLIDGVFWLIGSMLGAGSSGSSFSNDALSVLVSYWGLMFIKFLVAVVFWLLADRLAKLLAPAGQPAFAGGTLSAANLFNLLLLLSGVWLVIHGAGELAFHAASYWFPPDTGQYINPSPSTVQFLDPLLRSVLGVLLIASPKLRGWLGRGVKAGSRPAGH